jgi:Pretoxin HINT domain
MMIRPAAILLRVAIALVFSLGSSAVTMASGAAIFSPGLAFSGASRSSPTLSMSASTFSQAERQPSTRKSAVQRSGPASTFGYGIEQQTAEPRFRLLSAPLIKGLPGSSTEVRLNYFAYDVPPRSRVSQSSMATKPGACSFAGPTLVLMADGTTKPIGEVRVGDEVLAQDPETGEKSARMVTHLWVHDDEYVRLEIGGGTVLTTANHPFWNDTDKRWERADELNVGDMVLTADGRRVRVGHLQSAAGHGAAYNLTVEGLHTYHVLVRHDAVLVHNVCPVVELAENITQAKLDHIFVPKHNLGPLVAQFGSEEAVVSQMLNGVRGSVPASGTFVSTIQIGGQTVVVRGAVVNGTIRIGTAFTP